MKNFIALSFIHTLLLINSCKNPIVFEEPEVDENEILSTSLNLPEETIDYFKMMKVQLSNKASFDTINNEKATLGRVLFYDKKLSLNNSVSCATCHQPELAFSDGNIFSEGFNGEMTKRNTIALGSVVNYVSSYSNRGSLAPSLGFFWDNRAATLEEQSLHSIEDPIKMGMDIDLLGEKLLKEDYYKVLFKRAFEEEEDILSKQEQIVQALAHFLTSMVTINSKFDQGLALLPIPHSFSNPILPLPNFSDIENIGRFLYIDHCASCHGRKAIAVPGVVANIGLDPIYEDKGLGSITGESSDKGKFKVPQLRNVELTAPYMHDGRYVTLEEVIEHYNSGIQDHVNLDDRLKSEDGKPQKLNLTVGEKEALVIYLKTLTDVESLLEERYSDPFK